MTAVPGPAGPVPHRRRRDHLRRAFGRDGNPLVRPIDRSRSRVLLLTALGIGLALLFGAGAAADRFASVRHRESTTAARLHDVQAVTLAPAQRRIDPGTGRTRYEAEAAWTSPDGRGTTGTVSVPGSTATGSAVGIRVDDTGRPVPPPPGTIRAAADAACLGFLAFGGLTTLLIAGLSIRLMLLDRRADEAWQRSWSSFEPRWSGRTRRDNRAG
ncbi:hypothetical protein ACFWP2_34125 [Kitasatospora sp. NPDC058444]|uniref:Rv1733c family protein n=1 Tax=Kitasatospora sp. NPDC058444 TaxID=3346504 RepID=UPI0036514CB5